MESERKTKRAMLYNFTVEILLNRSIYINISLTVLNMLIQVGYWNSKDGVVMDPRQPVIWLSGSVNVPKDTSTLVENTTIRVMTVIVSMKPLVIPPCQN